MDRKYMTVLDATREWVGEMNAIQQGMIQKLMNIDPEDWCEVTKPADGDTVYIYNIPDELDTLEHSGEIKSYNEEDNLYCIELCDGNLVYTSENNFNVERDDSLPMLGTMWSFGDSADDWWLEEGDGIAIMSRCGFRIYVSEEFGYFFGIDGAGYNFYEAHWCPLYLARGLQWHNPVAEKIYQMELKGYKKRALGTNTYWFDGDKCIEEVQEIE